jgi:hypothetical protein
MDSRIWCRMSGQKRRTKIISALVSAGVYKSKGAALDAAVDLLFRAHAGEEAGLSWTRAVVLTKLAAMPFAVRSKEMPVRALNALANMGLADADDSDRYWITDAGREAVERMTVSRELRESVSVQPALKRGSMSS